MNAARGDLYSKARSDCLDRPPETLMNWCLRVQQGYYAGYVRGGLFQHLEPLATHWRIITTESRNISAGIRKTGNETIAYGVADTDEDYRQITHHRLDGGQCKICKYDEDIRR